jgi:hypothetical protein
LSWNLPRTGKPCELRIASVPAEHPPDTSLERYHYTFLLSQNFFRRHFLTPYGKMKTDLRVYELLPLFI